MANVEPGSIIGSYRVDSVAGRGGMGVVYVATQQRLDRQVALKVIAPDLAEDPGFRERFTHESQIAASIDHPNIIPVYEAGEHEGLLYLSMRYVHGTDLSKLLRQDGRIDPRRAARIVAQVGNALDAAHARGLVHRDVKPANVLIAEGDHAYLTDFGLTKHAESNSGLTKTGTWVGTVDYVAPEQVQGLAVDARTDVYALGCVLFHALAGQIPFPRPNEIAKIYAHLQEGPPAVDWAALGVPAAVDAVLRRAMAKEPGDRYQSAGDLGRAAAAAAEGQTVVAPERTVAAGSAAPMTGATTVAPSPHTATGATQALPDVPPTQALPGVPAGAQAPPGAAPTYAYSAPPGPAAYQPAPYYPPPQAGPPPGPPPARSRRTAYILAAIVLLLAGAGVAVAAATGVFSGGERTTNTSTVVNTVTSDATMDTAPPPTTDTPATISPGTVRELLTQYATAYSNEDTQSLATLFAPNFTRSAPPKAPMARSEALAEYDSQFADLADPTYTLNDVRIAIGDGEATADAGYEISDSAGPPATGTIRFHMTVTAGDVLLIDGLEIHSD